MKVGRLIVGLWIAVLAVSCAPQGDSVRIEGQTVRAVRR